MLKKVSAIVLAAGMSKRMGTLKQLVKIGNRTLLETTLEALSASAVHEIILVLGYRADDILKSTTLPSKATVVRNENYEQGMSTSIRAGIPSVSSDTNAEMIVLADQPYIKAAILNSIIEEYDRSNAKIVLPVYKGFRGNPVLIDRSLFPEMMQITGDIGCRSLFGLHADQVNKLNVDDIGILIDIDSPADLEKLSRGQLTETIEVEDRTIEPSRELLIVGNDDAARALAKFGKLLKFRVTIVDPLLNKNDAPEADKIMNDLDLSGAIETTYIVVASRGKFDEEALQQALSTPARYVALLGSKKRGNEIIQRLRNRKVTEEELKRIRCPAGLELHAETPEEIALSIVAEIVQMDRTR